MQRQTFPNLIQLYYFLLVTYFEPRTHHAIHTVWLERILLLAFSFGDEMSCVKTWATGTKLSLGKGVVLQRQTRH